MSIRQGARCPAAGGRHVKQLPERLGRLSMSTLLTSPTLPAVASPTGIWFRRALWVVSILTAIVLLISCVVMFWARNAFSTAESVVAAQSLMLAHDGTLYYDLNQYPYTVSGYMPVFYSLCAGLIKLGIPAFAASRLITMAGFLLLIATGYRLAFLYTEDRLLAWIAALLIGCNPLTFLWSEIGQVDILAVSFSALAFYHFSRYYVRGEPALTRATAIALLALFTKQTMIAVPVAMFLLLWFRDRKKALLFGAVFAGIGGGAVLAINTALHGRLIQDTVKANMNPVSWWKLLVQGEFVIMLSGCSIFIVAVSLGRLLRGNAIALCVYAASSALVFLMTAGKVGSDSNYQLEMAVALAITATVGLHRLDFLRLYFAGSKRWVTLLLLPVAVSITNGFRVVPSLIASRIAEEKLARVQLEELRPLVPPSGGLVFSSDYNSMVRLRGRLDVEPLIYGLLVRAGAVNPEPVRRDLARGAFSTVILAEDVTKPPQVEFAELIIVPEELRAAIRSHYRLVKHIPGGFQRELFVYQPALE